jgi:predicted nucleic-acid-binding Zn-ribbon protein
MQSGSCPQCGGTDIRERYAGHQNENTQDTLATRMFVCRTCGYLETYTDPNTIAAVDIESGWRRAALAPPQAATGDTIRLNSQDMTSPTSAASSPRCPSCGSEKLIPHVRIRDTGGNARGDLTVEVERRPSALIFRDEAVGVLFARICGVCG